MGERWGGGGRLLLTVRGAPGHSAHPDRAEPRRAPGPFAWISRPSPRRPHTRGSPPPPASLPPPPPASVSPSPASSPRPCESPARPAPLASHPPEDLLSDPPPQPLSLNTHSPPLPPPHRFLFSASLRSLFSAPFPSLSPICPHYCLPRPPPPISAPPPRPGCTVQRASLEQHQGPGAPTGWGRRAGSMGRGRPV